MTELNQATIFDAIVVGGGPSGATAADDLARAGHKVLLLDRAGRIKPCGGADWMTAIEKQTGHTLARNSAGQSPKPGGISTFSKPVP